MRLTETRLTSLIFILTVGMLLPSTVLLGAPDVDNVEKSIVRVVVGGHGTGWVVSPEVVATNWHVASGTDSYEIYPAGTNDVYQGTLRWIGDSELDIALIDVPGLPLEPFTIHTGETGRGSPSFTSGFPGLGDDLTGRANSNVSVYGGTIALIVENTAGVRIIQHTNIVNAGNSGGPLLDNCGRVLGLTTWGVENEEYQADFIWASVHVGELAEQMDRLGIPYNDDATECIASEGSTVIDNSTTTIVDTTDETNRIRKLIRNWGVGLGTLLAFTLALALRKPRQQIIHAVEQVSKVVKGGYPGRNQDGSVGSPSNTGNGGLVASAQLDGRQVRIELGSKRLRNEQKGISLGRAAELVDFQVTDELMSRRHLRFSIKQNSYYIEDLNSTNGTYVNGKQLLAYKPVEIHVGDSVAAGNCQFQISRL